MTYMPSKKLASLLLMTVMTVFIAGNAEAVCKVVNFGDDGNEYVDEYPTNSQSMCDFLGEGSDFSVLQNDTNTM